MTLGQLFERVSEQPAYVILYFAAIPLTAALAGWISREDGREAPWKYLYSALIYLVCVPGIFAVTLDIFLFLFERRSIFDLNLYTQVLPILSMVATLLIIRAYVNFDYIPGFDKISGLVMMISATLILMWIIDRTRIIVFSYVRFEVVIVMFIALLLVVRWGWSKVLGGSGRSAEA